jgi:hypothetical protein
MKRYLLLLILLIVPVRAQRLERIIHLSHVPEIGTLNLTDNKLYVLDPLLYQHGPSYQMSVIDCVADSVIKVLSVGPPSGGAANVLWTSRCNKLWKYEHSQYIKVFDAHADTLLDSIHCPFPDPLYWGYNPLVGKVYAGSQDCVAVMSEDGDSLLGLVTNRGNVPFWNPTNGCAYWSRGRWPDSLLYLDVRKGEDDTLTIASIEAPFHARNQLAFFVEGVDSARNLLIATQDTTTGFPEYASFPVVIDCARETVLSWFPLGWQGYTVVINQPYHKAYFLSGGCQIRALDYLSGAFRDIFPGGGGLKYFGAYSAATNRLYVFVDSLLAVSRIIVIDGATDSILRRIELPDGVGWLCFNPALHKLFINGNRGNAIPTDSSVQVYVESLPGGISNQARPQSLGAFSIVPSPALGNVTVRYALAAEGTVSLRVLDAQGRLVRQLATGNQPSGEHEFVWNRTSTRGSPVSRGVYFIQLLSRDENLSQKLVVQ